MSNLIPTPRTDKNGRTVTRHMKPHSQSAGSHSTKIPPVGMNGAGRSVLIASVTTLLTKAIRTNFPEGVAINDVRRAAPALASYSDATLARIQQHPWTFQSARTLTLSATKEWDETTVNDYMAAAVALNLTEGHSISVMHTDSWHLYDELHPANNVGEYPAERLSQIVALYHVTEHMEEEGLEPYGYGERSHEVESYYLNDDKLREFLLNPEEPYKRDDIVDIITTHNTYDVARIKTMLNHSVPALRGGVI